MDSFYLGPETDQLQNAKIFSSLLKIIAPYNTAIILCPLSTKDIAIFSTLNLLSISYHKDTVTVTVRCSVKNKAEVTQRVHIMG